MMENRERCLGSILGMAVGEALGAPLSGVPVDVIRAKLGSIQGFPDPRTFKLPIDAVEMRRGLYEDETELALAVAETLAVEGRFVPERCAELFADMARPQEGRAFGCLRRAHRNVRQALRRLIAGRPWTESGINTAGASAASRGIPIGVFFRDDPEARRRASVEATLITHRDPRACAGTAAVAAAVSLSLRAAAPPGDWEPLVAEIEAEARAAEDLAEEQWGKIFAEDSRPRLHEFSGAVSILGDVADLPPALAFAKIVNFAASKASRPITLPTGGFVHTAVLSALYVFLRFSRTFEEGIVEAVRHGGDADTMGALVGGLLGGFHGLRGIPEAWLLGLENRDQVLVRARVLLDRKLSRPDLLPLVATECQLTPVLPPAGALRAMARDRARAAKKGGRGREAGAGAPGRPAPGRRGAGAPPSRSRGGRSPLNPGPLPPPRSGGGYGIPDGRPEPPARRPALPPRPRRPGLP